MWFAQIKVKLIEAAQNGQKEPYSHSVVSIKQTGGNNQTGRADFFHLLHEKKSTGLGKKYFYYKKNEIRDPDSGWGKNFKIV